MRRLVTAVIVVVLVLVASRDHLAQLPLAGELASKMAVSCDELLANGKEGLLGRDGAIGLNTEQDLGDVGMGDCRQSKQIATDVG